MKKSILSFLTILTFIFGANAQTAVNFNCNDCQSVNHDLFTELNAGKIIVITWVMPCATCIPVASTVATTVQGYASSNPNTVKFYLVDDFANTTCATLNSWATTNSISTDANFSDASINMSDYGTPDMQKTVVLAGLNHDVVFNVNGTVSPSALETAINNALATSVNEKSSANLALSVFPSPVNGNKTTLNYTLSENSNVTIDVYNMLGSKVKNVLVVNQTIGKHEAEIDLTGFSNGVYFITIGVGEASQTVKFIVAK